MPGVSRKPARRARATGGSRAGGGARGRVRVYARRAAVLAVIALVFVGVWAARAPILRTAARALTVHDQLRRADAILVLGGGPQSRPDEAARIYRRGLATRVLVVQAEVDPPARLGVKPNDTELNVAVLRREGVPAAAIHVLPFPGGATSTYDEARAFREWAYGAKPNTVIVVTSAFHSRRARWLLRHQLDRLRVTVLMDPATEPDFNESNWWHVERGLIMYFEEYIKFAHEWTRD